MLHEKYPAIRLCVVGSGTDEGKLKELVKEKNLENIITFTGRLDNDKVLDLMNKSNIFLLPSVNEGFGITYIEAMRAGALAIGTKGEGIDGFIRSGKNGFLVKPKVEEIVNLIDNIYEGKYDIEQIRKKAYEDSKMLTWENNAKKYMKLFTENI